MKKPRWLRNRPGLVTPQIAVFDDEQENVMYLDKPVEVCADGRNKVVYVWLKTPGWRVQTEPVGGALDGYTFDQSLPPWPDGAFVKENMT